MPQVYNYARSLDIPVLSLLYLITYNILSDLRADGVVSFPVLHRDKININKHALSMGGRGQMGRHPVECMYPHPLGVGKNQAHPCTQFHYKRVHNGSLRGYGVHKCER